MRDTYTYEYVRVASSLETIIQNHCYEGNELLTSFSLESNADDGLTVLQCQRWVSSFSSIIDRLDPYDEENSGSLASRWYKAQWVGGNYPKTYWEYSVQFSQYLGVAESLVSRDIKVVKSKSSAEINSRSIFHKRDLPLQDNLVFVLMPFSESWSKYIWEEQIKPIVQGMKEYSLVCRRADDLFGRDVMQDVYESILTASIVIADITGRNANVFYELGIAHSLGKEVILLSQGSEHIPFDLNRFRHCIYTKRWPGIQNFGAVYTQCN